MIKNNFEKVFRALRKRYIAPPLELFGSDPYKTLVSTMLSARTRDETTFRISKNLFKKAPNVYKLNTLTINSIEKLIYPVGFYKTKAKNLKRLAMRLVDNFQGKVPSSLKDLTTLPGVGRKTGNLVLARAFNKNAIAVDTHVHRITNLLGWVKTKTPEKTEKELMKILPKKYWKETNRLFVSLGRQVRSQKKLTQFVKEINS